MTRRSRFLVLGAAGLVGSHVLRALIGRDVVGTFHRHAAEGLIHLDITDAEAIDRVMRDVRPTAVVLAAAEPHVEACERDRAGTRRVNVDAARSVRDAARDAGAVLVVFSSEYVFDGTNGPYCEDDARAPINEYGRQKVALEDLALELPGSLVCRVSGVFGAEPARKNFAAQLLDRLRAGREFHVPEDQVITPTDALTLGRAVVELLDAGASGIFHVAGPEVMGRAAFARLVADVFGLPADLVRPVPTSELGLLAARPRDAGLRDAKLRRVLGHGLPSPRAALEALRAAGA